MRRIAFFEVMKTFFSKPVENLFVLTLLIYGDLKITFIEKQNSKKYKMKIVF